MKNFKHQPSNIRKAAVYKLQKAPEIFSAPGWLDGDVSNGELVIREEPEKETNRHPFDLEERTARFGEAILRFIRRIPRNPANDRLTGQLAGASTSVGANYCEASEKVSQKDFINTVSRCVKEAKVTKFFLRMIVASEPGVAEEARGLYREAHELHLIFSARCVAMPKSVNKFLILMFS